MRIAGFFKAPSWDSVFNRHHSPSAASPAQKSVPPKAVQAAQAAPANPQGSSPPPAPQSPGPSNAEAQTNARREADVARERVGAAKEAKQAAQRIEKDHPKDKQADLSVAQAKADLNVAERTSTAADQNVRYLDVQGQAQLAKTRVDALNGSENSSPAVVTAARYSAADLDEQTTAEKDKYDRFVLQAKKAEAQATLPKLDAAVDRAEDNYKSAEKSKDPERIALAAEERSRAIDARHPISIETKAIDKAISANEALAKVHKLESEDAREARRKDHPVKEDGDLKDARKNAEKLRLQAQQSQDDVTALKNLVQQRSAAPASGVDPAAAEIDESVLAAAPTSEAVNGAVEQQRRVVSDLEVEAADERRTSIDAGRRARPDGGSPPGEATSNLTKERRTLVVMTSQRDALNLGTQVRVDEQGVQTAKLDAGQARTSAERNKAATNVKVAQAELDATRAHLNVKNLELQQFVNDVNFTSAVQAASAAFDRALKPRGLDSLKLPASIDEAKPGQDNSAAKTQLQDASRRAERVAQTADVVLELNKAVLEGSAGPRSVELTIADKAIGIGGGSPSEKLQAVDDLKAIFATPRGAEMLPLTSGLYVDLGYQSQGAYSPPDDNRGKHQEPPPEAIRYEDYVQINPRFRPLINTDEGRIQSSSVRILAHELGHQIFDEDSETKDIELNENRVANALGQPSRKNQW